jgi:PAS domain-containing protein
MAAEQKPLELIHARNLLTIISTPAFLVEGDGTLVFYNEAAGMLVGKRFEEAGKMSPEDWRQAFGPVDADGRPIDFEELPLTRALREGCPAHDRFRLRSADGAEHDIEISAIPLVGFAGFQGALAIFWPLGSGPGADGREAEEPGA